MKTSFDVLLNYGKHYRIWPFADVKHKELYVSVGLARPFVKTLCRLLRSRDNGESWDQISDFCHMDRRNTTTGQPFVTNVGEIFVPTWNAGFYTHGETWFAIYKSEDKGSLWKKVYEDPNGTYGKHFFQDPTDDSIYIGVGVKGGGFKGRISYTPAKAYLLKSDDHGRTWKKVLKIDYPTAIYSGATISNKTIVVTAREKKAIFTSHDGGNSWSETYLNNSTRSASNIEELRKLVVTSNSAIFISDDGSTWNRLTMPIKWLAIRYPTFYNGKLYMTADAGRSYIISTDLKKWYLAFDVTKKTGSDLFGRMAIVNDHMFLGGEMNGLLLRVKLPMDNNEPIDTSQLFETNLKCLISTAIFQIKRALGMM